MASEEKMKMEWRCLKEILWVVSWEMWAFLISWWKPQENIHILQVHSALSHQIEMKGWEQPQVGCWVSTEVEGQGPAKSRLQRHGALAGRGAVTPCDVAVGRQPSSLPAHIGKDDSLPLFWLHWPEWTHAFTISHLEHSSSLSPVLSSATVWYL